MLVFDKISTFSENCYFSCKMFVFAENALIFAPIFGLRECLLRVFAIRNV